MSRPLARRHFLALAGLASVGAAGCTALDGSAGQQRPDGAAAPTGADGVEQSDLRVGALPIIGSIPVSLGVNEGLFSDAGLSVEIVPIQSGALSVPSLVAGEFDLMFSNYVTPILASTQGGVDLVIVAEASRALPNNYGIVAMPDSPINVPTDLVGRTIGVNALNHVGTLTTSSVLGVNGVLPEQVEFREFPFPEVATAMETGQIDAGFLPEPFLTAAKQSLGVKTILDPCSGPTADLPMDGYVTTRAFAEANPATVAAFRTGIAQAQQRAADRATLEPMMVETARVDPTIAPLISAANFPTTLSQPGIQRVADLMAQFGVLPQPVDVSSLIVA